MSDVIYLDNAATSFPKPPAVANAMSRFLAEDAANPGRAGHRMAVAAESMLDDLRLKLTRLVGGDDMHRMILTMNGTDALNMAIKGVLSRKPSGDREPAHVITTVLEHNSVSRPLQAMADAGCISLTRLGCDASGLVDPSAIGAAITPATRLIAMTHASNVTGVIQNAAAVGVIAREAGVLFLLDVAQTIGVLPIDIGSLGVDLLAFPGHKSLLGPTGTGALYVGERCLDAVEASDPDARRNVFSPWREGGTGGDSATPIQPAELPYFLEGGTPNTVGAAGLSAAIDYVLEVGIEHTLAHEQRLVGRILEHMLKDDRVTLLGSPKAEGRVGTVSFNVAGYGADDIGAILDDSFNVAARPGLHCAPYVHQAMGTFPSGAVRVSPGVFTTDDDVSALLEAIDAIAGG